MKWLQLINWIVCKLKKKISCTSLFYYFFSYKNTNYFLHLVYNSRRSMTAVYAVILFFFEDFFFVGIQLRSHCSGNAFVGSLIYKNATQMAHCFIYTILHCFPNTTFRKFVAAETAAAALNNNKSSSNVHLSNTFFL